MMTPTISSRLSYLFTISILSLSCHLAGRAQGKYVFPQEILPLTETAWAQWYPYSRYCPTITIDSTEKHVYAGCAPLAMSQMLKACRKPVISERLNRTYDWNNMPSTLDTANQQQQMEVARLIRDCGIAAYTNYQQTASSTKLNEVVAGLKQYFGMSKYMHIADRNQYRGIAGDRMWKEMIYEELNGGRPVIIRGQKGKNFAHVFLIDGCRDSLVHVNFGWGGKRNGYYDPDSLFGFTANQRMIIGATTGNIQPRVRRIIIEKAGQLHQLITEKDWLTMHHIKIYGLLNRQDIALLRQLAGGGQKGERNGRLATIDLTETALISLPDSAFYGCSSLTYIALPAMLPEVSNSAFQNCQLLNEVVLPAMLNRIRRAAFSGCFCLNDIQFPESLQTIDSNAFNSCNRLVDVTVPSGVKAVGNGAFANCKHLRSLSLAKTTRLLSNNITHNTKVKRITFR